MFLCVQDISALRNAFGWRSVRKHRIRCHHPRDAFKIALEREHPALEAQNLGVGKALFVVNKQNITATTVFIISTDPTVGLVPPAPTVGGGTTDIEMLVGLNNQPNANAVRMTATFWVETVDGPNGPFQQLQYTQRVLLNFGGLNWPHISVATLI